MNRPCNSLTTLLVLVLFPVLAFSEPTINYQGRVTASGTNFTGTGYFKFVLFSGLNQSGQVSEVWTHHGNASTNEPGTSIALPLNNGLFNLNLGDTVSGFAKIPGPLFHFGNITIRAWFSTDNVTFERLRPDGFIYPDGFGDLDTARMVVVDNNGNADFTDIQEAINYAATNFSHVWLMPGFYSISAPLTFPTNQNMVLRGFSRDSVYIANTNNGPAAIPNNVTLENISFEGDPAISDMGLPMNYRSEFNRCRIDRLNAGGPALHLSGSGQTRMIDVEIHNGKGGNAADLSGNINLAARNVQFQTFNSGDDALSISNNVEVRMNDSDLSSQNGRALTVGSGMGRAQFWNTDINANIDIEASSFNLHFNTCRISGKAPAAVSVIDADRTCRFVNCALLGQDSPIIYLEAGLGSESVVDVLQSTLNSFTSVSASNIPSILVTNAMGNFTENAEVYLAGSEVITGIGSAVKAWNAEVSMTASSLESLGGPAGISMTGGQLNMTDSQLEAGGHGIEIAGGQIDIKRSSVSIEDDGAFGLRVQGNTSFNLIDFDVTSEGFGGAGLLFMPSLAGAPTGRVVAAKIMTPGTAIDADGATFVVSDSFLHTETGTVVILRNSGQPPLAIFNHTTFFRPPGEESPNPGLALHAPGGGTNAPMPKIVNCTFDVPGAIGAIMLTGGVTTGTVSMVNSSLSTNLGPGVAIAPATPLGFGNVRF